MIQDWWFASISRNLHNFLIYRLWTKPNCRHTLGVIVGYSWFFFFLQYHYSKKWKKYLFGFWSVLTRWVNGWRAMGHLQWQCSLKLKDKTLEKVVNEPQSGWMSHWPTKRWETQSTPGQVQDSLCGWPWGLGHVIYRTSKGNQLPVRPISARFIIL